ncbi:MAG: hypothetical protein ACQEQF_06370 [Bacillota bacterium]
MSKNITAAEIVNAIDNLEAALEKVSKITLEEINFSKRVLDNRIITLEGYLRFLESEGIPRLESTIIQKEGENID